MTVEDSKQDNLKLCECGFCNELIPIINKKGKPARFKHNHHRFGRKGELSTNWKGGRYLSSNRSQKYWKVLSPNHPNADPKGYVFEHRLVMEKHLGRYLTKEEVVHHIDKNTQNNLIENLMLFPNDSEHLSYERTLDMSNRICLLCLSTKSRIRVRSGRYEWYHYQDGFICHNCYSKLLRVKKKNVK